MLMLETRKVASFPIAMLQNASAIHEFDGAFHGHLSDSARSTQKTGHGFSRRNFIKSAGLGAGLLLVGGTSFNPKEAEAAIPALLLAMIGIFSVATLWSVQEPASGRIALLNPSDREQTGRVDFNAFNNISLQRTHRLPIDEWRRLTNGEPRVFSGSSPYEVAAKTADIYDVYGLKSPIRTNNLLVTAETRKDYFPVSAISVV